jgi:potassium efflux system protein
MTTPRRASYGLIRLCAGLWLVPALGHAQLIPAAEPDAAVAEPAAADAGPGEPERLTDRMTELREARQTAENLQAGTRLKDEAARVIETWDAAADASQVLAENLDRAREQTVAGDILRDRSAAAEHRRAEIAEWMHTLQAEIERLDSVSRRAEELQETWRARRQLSAEDQGWAELLPMIGPLLDSVKKVPAEVAGLREEVSSRLASLDQVDHRLQGAIDAAHAQQKRQGSAGWFRLDGPPLSDLSKLDVNAMGGHARERWRLNLEVLRAYLARYPEPYFGQVGLWLASTLLLFRAGRRRRQGAVEATDPGLDAVVARAQRRPVAAGFVVSVGVSMLLHDDPPTLHSAFLHTFGVLAAISVLSGVRPTSPRPALYILWLIVAADWLRALALGATSLDRIVMDGELLLLTGLCTALLTQPDATHGPYLDYRRWLPAIYRALRATALLAVGADLIGLATIGRSLAHGALHTTYLLSVSIAVYWGLLGSISALCHEPFAQTVHSLQARRDQVLPWLARLAHRVLPLAWIWIASASFGVSEALGSTLGWIWHAKATFGDVSISIADLVIFGFVVWASLFISSLLRAVLEDDVMARANLPSGVPYAISTTAHYLVVLLGAFLAFNAAGVDMSRFTVLAGAFGVGIGFGMQTVVSNFVSGLILLYERPIKVGDTIEVENVQGDVKRIGIRSSTVRTFTGAEVLVPNATLIATKVINFTLNDRSRRIDLPVGVAYGTDPVAVLELLRTVATSHSQVLTTPKPLPLFLGFGASSLDFELRVWVADFGEGASVRSDLAIALNAALVAASIEVPFPQQDVHIRSVAAGLLPDKT